MQDATVNILGSAWEIKIGNVVDYPALSEVDGFADPSTRMIVISDLKKIQNDDFALGNLKGYQERCLRHEIIHAFMEESGLSSNFEHKMIGVEETMVDWFVIQSPKIFEVFKELDLL